MAFTTTDTAIETATVTTAVQNKEEPPTVAAIEEPQLAKAPPAGGQK